MKKTLIAAIALAMTSSIALAQTSPRSIEDNSLSSKVANDLLHASPGGTTANATAKPLDGGISGKAMRDHPGVR